MNDDDVICIANCIHQVPTIVFVDLSGNSCLANGANALKEAIISHCTLGGFSNMKDGQREDNDDLPMLGLRELYLDNNPIGDLGMIELTEAIQKTFTLTTLSISNCSIGDVGMDALKEALKDNCTIVNLNIAGNPAKRQSTARARAEAEAMEMIHNLEESSDTIDAGTLRSSVRYSVC